MVERRPDRSAEPGSTIRGTNPAAPLENEEGFMMADGADSTPLEIYRTLKLLNLGLLDLADAELEAAEAGPNQCAVGTG
jgi:hypothetical protein